MKTHITALALSAVALLTLAASAYGYDCGVVDRTARYGPHRKINDIALKAYLANDAKDEKRAKFLKSLDMKRLPLLTGIAVKEAGGEIIKEGAENGTFDWWIVEGGFTADEPEIFNSFRHFYDPAKANGVYYLTDHLNELDYILRVVVFAITKSALATYIMPSPNPCVDARDWAINGTQNGGIRPNAYCWNRGTEYMGKAFASKGKDKDELYAKAWRSLGETMHLISDMNCPPHVRNDSHPGRAIADYIWVGNDDVNKGFLKNDPYELLATAEIVEAAAKQGLVPNAKTLVDGSQDPMTLFDKVATYTNHRFLTAETISGKLWDVECHNANGMPDYDFPKIEKMAYDDKTGYFSMDFDGRSVKMAHLTWLGEEGWGEPPDRMAISSECVRDQAGVLVPIAAYANAKLLDWFIPRVEVALEEFDPATKVIKGQVLHTPYGAYSKALLYNSGSAETTELYINDLSQAVSSYTVKVEDGKLSLDLSGVDQRIFNNTRKVALQMSIGGMMLRSEDFCFLKIVPEEIPVAWVNTEYAFTGVANPVPEKVKKVSYKWDFGDGTKTMDYPYEKPLAQPLNVPGKHKFEKEGKYTVNLEVADVTGGLWRTLYEAKSEVSVLRPISDKEATDAAMAFIKGTYMSTKLPANVKVSGITVSSIDRQYRQYINVPSIYMPSGASIYMKLTGKETIEGAERDWSTLVNVSVGINKYGGSIEACEPVSATGMNDAY